MKRQIRLRFFGLAAGTVVFGAISACGGAGGGGVGIADGGIRGTGSSVGPVSGFGSVFVNGVEFSTRGIVNQLVESNDGIEFETDLSEGMILRVEGEWLDDGTGTAKKLSYDDTLRGPVGPIIPDPSGAGDFVTLTVMGQSVRVDRQTVVRGTNFAALLGGELVTDHVRVSAWRQADGSYRAGYIGTVSPDLGDVELEGSVTATDINQNQFSIGTITVQYDEDVVSFGSGLSETDLKIGAVLEIEGALAGNVLSATTLDRDDARRFSRSSNDDIEFTATIDSPYTPSGTEARPGEFKMGSLTVRVTDATELDDSITLDDLTEGLLIQVEGTFLSDTLVEAEEIELRDGNAKVQGVVSSVADNAFVVGGVEIRVSPTTTFTVEDDSDMSFVSLPTSNTVVEVEGIEREVGPDIFIEALKVEVDDQPADAENLFKLEGRLQFISENPSITGLSILGLTLSDLNAEYDGEDETNARMDVVTAFNSPGAVILEVAYRQTESGFVAEEVEPEEKDND